jgi:hypothetical protein
MTPMIILLLKVRVETPNIFAICFGRTNCVSISSLEPETLLQRQVEAESGTKMHPKAPRHIKQLWCGNSVVKLHKCLNINVKPSLSRRLYSAKIFRALGPVRFSSRL